MSRAMNALVGAAVTVLLLPSVPFSPVLGGAVAGYLEGADGVPVGALSGVIAFIPAFALFVLLGGLGLGIGLLSPIAAGITLVVLSVGFVVLLVYVLVLSAIGGVIGAYLESELG